MRQGSWSNKTSRSKRKDEIGKLPRVCRLERYNIQLFDRFRKEKTYMSVGDRHNDPRCQFGHGVPSFRGSHIRHPMGIEESDWILLDIDS